MWTLAGLTMLGALLNRTRGAWFRMYIWDSGTTARMVWAVPTGLLLWYGTTPQISYTEFPFRACLLIASCFAMWALLGSGAHSVMNFQKWKDEWNKGNLPDDTEMYSEWILKQFFYGKTPDPLWTEDRFRAFHMLGKAIEGVLRMAIMVLPIIILAPGAAVVLILSGCVWGMLFDLGWAADDDHGWTYGELLTGAWTYFIIGLCFYIV